jgi:uncharacterized membrane protein
MRELIIASLAFLFLDGFFLWFQSSIFTNQLQLIQGSETKLKIFGVVFCYFFLLFALHYFILFPKKSILDAFLLGICIYGVYEGTTYATLNKWPLFLVFIDTLWGGILFAGSTWIGRFF